MSPEEEARRGAEARQLTEHPIYREAMQSVEDGLINAIKGSALGDESTHHRLAIALQLLSQIKNHVDAVIQTGHMAEFQLKRDSRLQRVKSAIGL